MPDNTDKSSARRKMHKRVETKEDGRFLIYYTFEESPGAAEKKDSKSEAVRK
jgi:hypothetical protein